jgi:ribonuclease P protein component
MKLVTVKKNSDIQYILKNGKRVSSPFFNMCYIAKEGPATFAIAAPKKIFTKAVLRNKAKRRLRAAITSVSIDGISAVVLAKSQLLDAKFSDVIEQLNHMFAKIKL